MAMFGKGHDLHRVRLSIIGVSPLASRFCNYIRVTFAKSLLTRELHTAMNDYGKSSLSTQDQKAHLGWSLTELCYNSRRDVEIFTHLVDLGCAARGCFQSSGRCDRDRILLLLPGQSVQLRL